MKIVSLLSLIYSWQMSCILPDCCQLQSIIQAKPTSGRNIKNKIKTIEQQILVLFT